VTAPSNVCATSATIGSVATGRPTSPSHRAKHKNASTKCVAGPATITRARCQTGLAPKVRGTSSSGVSWYGFIPAIFTYPPAGMALIPYSVSPRRNDQMRGPKPTKNSSTLIPNHLAMPK